MAVFLLTCGLTPALVGTMKKSIGAHCPYSVDRYGGTEPYRHPLSPHDSCCPERKRGACWPAGHASGGFALVALATLTRTRRGLRRGLLTGLLAGWITGGYQMLKGAHYLSDTIVTMLLAWLLHLTLRRLLLHGSRVPEDAPPAGSGHTQMS
jgi:membrane-associated PAP2 superfamily phosphatase